MPLHFHKYIKPEGEVGIWKIKEPISFFLQNMELTDVEKDHVNKIRGHLKVEWLASRYLLHIMSGRTERGELLKDKYGKPFLKDSTYQISLSHSAELAAVAASPKIVGVDIQKIVPKIKRIANKFMRPEELKVLSTNDIFHLHLFWGAKECLYKSYGKRKLDFRKHIHIEPFILRGEEGTFSGKVMKGDFKEEYKITYQKIDDYLLVHSIQL